MWFFIYKVVINKYDLLISLQLCTQMLGKHLHRAG